LEQEFRDMDILVSSTAAPHAIITLDKLAPFLLTRRHQPLFMIDLAMPRDIDPAVQKLDGVYLYNLDSLQSMAERTLAVRKQESEKCHQLIEYHVQDFQQWIERTQSSNFPSPKANADVEEHDDVTDRMDEPYVIPYTKFASLDLGAPS
jgi:glutamyl-tRNA reductase